MKFTCSDLRQFTDEYLKSLSSERKDELCFAFLYDLRDTHDIINRNSSNSSQPSSKDNPWESKPTKATGNENSKKTKPNADTAKTNEAEEVAIDLSDDLTFLDEKLEEKIAEENGKS